MTQPGPLPPPMSPLPPMPPVYFPPPAAYPRRPSLLWGFARGVFASMLVSLFGFSILLNLYLMFGDRNASGVKSAVVRDGDSKHVIALLPVSGVINGNTVADVEAMLGEIEKDKSVKAVVLEVNTPGGEVTASDVLYDRILRLKKTHNWPVVVSMGALATSGGYYISCAADAIVAQRTTWTGNVGVLIPRMNFYGLANKYGVTDETIKSTGSDFKDATSSFKPETLENQAYFQKLADDTFATFKQVVVAGRSLSPAVVDRLANGKVYLGPEAAKLNLVDQIGYLDDAIALAASKSNLGGITPKVLRFEKTRGLFESYAGSKLKDSAGTSGVNVSIDRAVIDDYLAPRPMYLWRGE